MQLIGMLDSPYVRRVAVALLALELPFEHRSISVFRGVDDFARINPVVKAPTLVADDGTVLMDSTLILQYAQSLAPRRRLWSDDAAALARDLRIVGLALAACEKSVQLLYENALRPPEKRHAPWVDRVTRQARTAYAGLDAAVAARAAQSGPARTAAGDGDAPLDDARISAAVAWHFTQQIHPGLLHDANHPALAAGSALAERRPEFAAARHGDGTVPTTG